MWVITLFHLNGFFVFLKFCTQNLANNTPFRHFRICGNIHIWWWSPNMYRKVARATTLVAFFVSSFFSDIYLCPTCCCFQVARSFVYGYRILKRRERQNESPFEIEKLQSPRHNTYIATWNKFECKPWVVFRTYNLQRFETFSFTKICNTDLEWRLHN